MGWCTGTYVFDGVVKALLDESKTVSKEKVISELIDTLEDNDWDCQGDSEFFEHPLIQKIFREKHPDMFGP